MPSIAIHSPAGANSARGVDCATHPTADTEKVDATRRNSTSGRKEMPLRNPRKFRRKSSTKLTERRGSDASTEVLFLSPRNIIFSFCLCHKHWSLIVSAKKFKLSFYQENITEHNNISGRGLGSSGFWC